MARLWVLDQDELRQFIEIVNTLRFGGRHLLLGWQQDLLDSMIETKPDMTLSASPLENERDRWMRRFYDHLQINEDRGAALGCWIWTGAPRTRRSDAPLYRYQDKNLPVRARMLEIWPHYTVPAGARISVTCPNHKCVRPEHLKVEVNREIVWPPQLVAKEQETATRLQAEASLFATPPWEPLDVEALRELPDPSTDEELQLRWQGARRLARRPAQKLSTPRANESDSNDPLAYAASLLDEAPSTVQNMQETPENLQDSASIEKLSNLMCEQTLDLQLQLEQLAARLA